MFTPPYKYRFRRELASFIKEAEPYETVLDIACAGLKFRSFFGPGYTGADISPLPAGTQVRAGDRFITGDLASNPFFLLGEVFDLVVSTHTFAHLPEQAKFQALSNLRSVMNEESFLIIQLTKSDWTLLSEEIASSFNPIKHAAYRGWVSSVFERFSRNLRKKNVIVTALSYSLSFVDFGSWDVVLLLQPR